MNRLSDRCADCAECAKCFGGFLSRAASRGAARASAAIGSYRGGEFVKLRSGFPSRSGGRDYSELGATSPVGEKAGLGDDELVQPVKYDHAVVMVHGLYGAPGDWDVLRAKLEDQLESEGERVILYASGANRKSNSLVGIDVCSQRLSEEIAILVRRHPTLERISFLCHSMGGLIARHASGVNFDPKTKRIYGLEPRHFITIASPHLGCHYDDGETQVPMIGWGRSIPLLGGTVLKSVFKVGTNPIIGMVYKNTGKHLFMTDGGGVEDPLVLKLVQDRPGEGWFFSALAQFRTRVCYANTYGDAMVGWANASLRRREELPVDRCKSKKTHGVILEDTIDRGFWSWNPGKAASNDGDLSGEEEKNDSERESFDDVEMEIMDRGLHAEQFSRGDDDSSDGASVGGTIPGMVTCDSFNAAGDVINLKDRQAVVDYMLTRLRSLPWCRVDVSFRKRSVPFCAHTHIQVTRKWIDFMGMSVADHISRQFIELQKFVIDSEQKPEVEKERG